MRFFTAGPTIAGRPPASLRESRWIRGAAAGVAALAGAIVVTFALVPGTAWGVLAPLAVEPGPPTALSHVLAAAAGAGALLIARGLWWGSRRAAAVAVGALALGAGHVLVGGAAAEALLPLGAAGFIVVGRGAFPRGGGTAGRAAGAVAAAATGAAYVVAAVALLVADRATGLGSALAQAGGWLFRGGWWLSSGALAMVTLDVLLAVALGAGAVALYAALRPAGGRVGHRPDEHERARTLVTAHATDSLDPFLLREDKAYHFAHGGVLAYRTVRETAIVAGDPVAPPGAAAAVLADFEAAAARRGWDVVVTAASVRHLEGYRALGFRTLRIGDEAVVDPRGFTLDGKAMKTVRKAVHRVERHGWSAEVVAGDALAPASVLQIAALDAAWRRRQPRLQGFSMTLGRLWGAPEDGESTYVLGRDATGTLQAFLRFADYPGGLSLDVMRRAANEPNGVNEFLIVAALAHAAQQGHREVSLNFAGFSHIMAAKGELTRRQALLRRALMLGHGRFQLDRLARFNDRFGPVWRPRHLVYRDLLSLPRAGLRVLQAEAYVRTPRSAELTARWAPSRQPVAAERPGLVSAASR